MKSILWGTLLIILGIILTLNAFNILTINLFFEGWWTLFIIIPSIIDIITKEDKKGSIVGLVIGILLLLACQDIISFNLIFKLIIPISLIIIGVSFIFKDRVNNVIKEQIKKLNERKTSEYCATFGNQTLDFTNEKFEGCTLSSVFGSIDCNLKNATIESDVVLNVSCIFGGAHIYLPKDVNVKVLSTSIFGGIDKKIDNDKTHKVTVYINATCLFGGIEIEWKIHKKESNIYQLV